MLRPISQKIFSRKFHKSICLSISSILLPYQSLFAQPSNNLSLCPSDSDLKTGAISSQQPDVYRRFVEGAWDISIAREYRGKCKLSIGERIQKVDGSWIESNASPLNLDGSTFSGTQIRHIYTWEKAGRKYLVIWQPTDDRFVRLEVINSTGTIESNVLLPQVDR